MGKVDRVKYKTRISKRRFYWNQHSQQEVVEQRQPDGGDYQESQAKEVENSSQGESSPVNTQTVSSSKVKDIPTDAPKRTDPNVTGYRFVDVEILTEIVAMLCCPECKKYNLHLHENFTEKKGFASLLFIECLQCGFEKEFYTSKPAGKSYDVNRRIIYTMRSIGQGYSSLRKFTALMNMPQPMTVKKWSC